MLPRCQFRLGYRVFRVRRLRGVSLSVVLTIAKNPGSILTIVGRSEPFWVSCERRAVGGNPVARENGYRRRIAKDYLWHETTGNC